LAVVYVSDKRYPLSEGSPEYVFRLIKNLEQELQETGPVSPFRCPDATDVAISPRSTKQRSVLSRRPDYRL
jgi:hypothetical protein